MIAEGWILPTNLAPTFPPRRQRPVPSEQLYECEAWISGANRHAEDPIRRTRSALHLPASQHELTRTAVTDAPTESVSIGHRTELAGAPAA